MGFKTDIEIVGNAPKMAVTYCMYDYGDEMEGVYLNCENQFFDGGRWVDIGLVDDLFHSHRRIDDVKAINALKSHCCGCSLGIYKDVQGMHRDSESNPVLVCNK